MPEGIEDALVGENTVGGDEIVQHFRGNIDEVLRHSSLETIG